MSDFGGVRAVYGAPANPGKGRDILNPNQEQSAFAADLDIVLAKVRELLIQKNAAYGDSALNPVRIFSKADRVEQMRVRIDDKLSRLARGEAAGEDVLQDLLGYLVLLEIAEMRKGREALAMVGAKHEQ